MVSRLDEFRVVYRYGYSLSRPLTLLTLTYLIDVDAHLLLEVLPLDTDTSDFLERFPHKQLDPD